MQKWTLKHTMAWSVVCLVLVIGWCTALAYMQVPEGPPDTLRAFPEDCDLVVTVDLVRARQVLKEVDQVIEQLSAMEVDEVRVLSWLQSAFDEFGSTDAGTPVIDLRSDILPWIGRDVSIGLDYDMESVMASIETADPVETGELGFASSASYEEVLNYAMCVISCRDAGRAEPFLDKLEGMLREGGLEPVTVTIAEHRWTCVGRDRLMGLIGIAQDRLIAFLAPVSKTITNLERVVELLKSEDGSIASSSEYGRMMDEIGQGSIVSLFGSATLDSSLFESGIENAGIDMTQSIGDIRSSVVVGLFADSTGVRTRVAGLFTSDLLPETAESEEYSSDFLLLRDTSVSVPDCAVGFIQLGPAYDYWSIVRESLSAVSIPAENDAGTRKRSRATGAEETAGEEAGIADEPYSHAGESAIVPEEVLTFFDTLMSHFVGDTHIALTGDSKRPMLVVTARVSDGEMLVSYLEMLATQSTPGLQIHFSDHGGEPVKTMWRREEEGLMSLVSYCLVDEVLVVSNLEPAVRLTIDTVRGTMPSAEQNPTVARMRREMGDGGMYLFHVDVGSLIEFLQPFAIDLPSDKAEWIHTIGRVFERVSGHAYARDDLFKGEFEIAFRIAPEPDVAEPSVVESGTAEPEPGSLQPGATEPGATEPGVSTSSGEPVESQ